MKTIDNFRPQRKKILLRVDLNVPLVDGVIIDKSRIRSALPTIKKLVESKNKIFLLSHFGRPKGKINKQLSLKFLCEVLCEEIGVDEIYFVELMNVKEIMSVQNKMQDGGICLLENIRFYKEEEENNLDFSNKISKFFDIFVNDAFSVSHREHASIVGITKFLPALAGYSMVNEIKNLDIFINTPKKPNTAIIGGSKISTKIEALNYLIERFNYIIIGGAMANTFILASGYAVGKSIVEINLVDVAKKILIKAKNFNCKLILPIDVVCSDNFKDLDNVRYSTVEDVLPEQMILDIGRKSIQNINKILLRSSMILWNGPLGAFEFKPFDHATMEIAQSIKKNSKSLKMTTLAGGGDTIAAIKAAKAEDSFTYISNAGGAFLEWLEGNESPGVKALKENTLT